MRRPLYFTEFLTGVRPPDRRKRRWWRWAAGVLGGLAILLAVVLLVWLAPPALYGDLSGKERASAEATTRTGLIAGLAGLAALGSLAFTARTYRLTEQGQLTDRYTKAIEQLGADKLDIRLGGIYALERIANDSKRDHPTVVEVLGAFVRERSNPLRREKPSLADVLHTFLNPGDESREAPPDSSQSSLPADIQAALTVLGRLPKQPDVSRGDLANARLSRALLHSADLSGAQLYGANLSGAWLGGANLSGADLSGADLRGVRNLTQGQLDSAQGDARTELPDGLVERPSHWAV